MTAAQRSVRNTWLTGLGLYVLSSLALGMVAPIFIPWLGTAFLAACAARHERVMKSDERGVLILGSVQLLAGIATLLLLPRKTALEEIAFSASFLLAVIIPIVALAYALARVRLQRCGTD